MSELKKRTVTLELPVQIAEARPPKWKAKAAGMIRAGDLYERFEIPQRNHREKTGYQRELSKPRVNRLVKELRSDQVDLPTSILANIRDFDPDRNLFVVDNQFYLRLTDEKLHVVDGQHRIAALVNLIEEDPEKWEDFEIPFVSMLGADELEEMTQFYVVNSTAKSVRTDLAFDLLKQRAEADPLLHENLEGSGQSWKVKGQTLTEELNRTSLWRGLIRFPGEPKGSAIIGSASVVNSLRPLLSNPYFERITTPNQIKVLDAYWRGIQLVMPEPFVDASEYTIQKGLGTTVMHGLLVIVLEHVRAMGRSVVEAQPYADLLDRVLMDLQGDTPTGDVVSGEQFWRTGSEGAVSSYSSSAGQRVLIAKLKTLLPPIEVM
jgi:DGQHR domain-containing protein